MDQHTLSRRKFIKTTSVTSGTSMFGSKMSHEYFPRFTHNTKVAGYGTAYY